MTVDFGNLVVLTPCGKRWRWVGRELVRSMRRRQLVHVERVTAPCRYCGAPMTATIKLASRLLQDYVARCVRTPPGSDVEIKLPKRRGQLERVNCPAHARSPKPAEVV